MADSSHSELGIDDERFDDLFDSIEVVLGAFFEEVIADEGSDSPDSQTDLDKKVTAESELVMGYLAVVLAALDARILSTSKNKDNQDTYEIRLTVPSDDIRGVVRQVMDNLEVNEFD